MIATPYTKELNDIREKLRKVHFSIIRSYALLFNKPIEKYHFDTESRNSDAVLFIIGDKYTGHVFNWNSKYFEQYPIIIGGTVLIETPYEDISGTYTVVKSLDNTHGRIEYLIEK